MNRFTGDLKETLLHKYQKQKLSIEDIERIKKDQNLNKIITAYNLKIETKEDEVNLYKIQRSLLIQYLLTECDYLVLKHNLELEAGHPLEEEDVLEELEVINAKDPISRMDPLYYDLKYEDIKHIKENINAIRKLEELGPYHTLRTEREQDALEAMEEDWTTCTNYEACIGNLPNFRKYKKLGLEEYAKKIIPKLDDLLKEKKEEERKIKIIWKKIDKNYERRLIEEQQQDLEDQIEIDNARNDPYLTKIKEAYSLTLESIYDLDVLKQLQQDLLVDYLITDANYIVFKHNLELEAGSMLEEEDVYEEFEVINPKLPITRFLDLDKNISQEEEQKIEEDFDLMISLEDSFYPLSENANIMIDALKEGSWRNCTNYQNCIGFIPNLKFYKEIQLDKYADELKSNRKISQKTYKK